LGKLYVGTYDSEEDAARAYDCTAVKLLSPDFPSATSQMIEIITTPPESRGEERRRLKASR
jgi:hypothetical protein